MPACKGRPPAFELDVAAEAKDIRLLVPGRVQTRSEGVTLVRHSRRAGLPDQVLQGGRYADVRVSFRIAAWLEDAGRAIES
jgi:hypothetical protein